MATRTAFPITEFFNLDGTPLASGYLAISINTDVNTPDPGQIGAQAVSHVELDAEGTITGSPTFWGNANLLPAGSVYLLSSYTAEGQQVLYRVPVTV